MANFSDLNWSNGIANIAGLQATHYFAPISEFSNFPEPIAADMDSASALTDIVTLESTTGFTFNTGGFFRKLYATLEEGEIKDDSQGPRDGKSYKHSASVIYPGTKAEALAFAAAVNNANMCFVFIDAEGIPCSGNC